MEPLVILCNSEADERRWARDSLGKLCGDSQSAPINAFFRSLFLDEQLEEGARAIECLPGRLRLGPDFELTAFFAKSISELL